MGSVGNTLVNLGFSIVYSSEISSNNSLKQNCLNTKAQGVDKLCSYKCVQTGSIVHELPVMRRLLCLWPVCLVTFKHVRYMCDGIQNFVSYFSVSICSLKSLHTLPRVSIYILQQSPYTSNSLHIHSTVSIYIVKKSTDTDKDIHIQKK